MNPTDEEIDRVANLLHESHNDFLLEHYPDRARDCVPYAALSERNKVKYRHAALTVLNDLWARWNPTTGGPT